MAVPEYVIEQIRNSNDIVSVISEHIILKKTGANHKAICPFHKEKTPSFVVSPEKQIFHCFGCGEGGNVFSFIMKYENISFFEALKKLADRAGIVLPEDAVSKQQDKSRDEKKLLYEINRCAADYYKECLQNSPSAKIAREYVKKRKLTRQIIDKFDIGYAPSTSCEMLKLIKEKGYSKELFKKAGLMVFSEKSGKWIDKFYNRIMFPITDNEGRVIAFGARAFDDAVPKYLNSPDTPLFNKSKVLYGLNLAKKPIREKSRMIVVEGYMDVMTAHQYGFENTVATLGTALTEEHARIIPRYTEKVSIVYDSDAAGVNATLRGIGVLLDTNLSVTVSVFPDGSDPDSFLHSRGSDEFFKRIENGMEIVDYKIKIASDGVDINTTGGKISVASQVLPFLERLKNEIYQEEGIKKLSGAIKIPAHVLKEELKRSRKSRPALKSRFEKINRQNIAELKLENNLVLILLKYPELAPIIFDEKKLPVDEFNNNNLSIIMSVILQLHEQAKPVEAKNIMNLVCSRYEKDESILEEINKTVSSLYLAKIEYRNPEKTARILIDDYNAVKSKKKYDELKKAVVMSLVNGDRKKSKEFVEQYKLIKGTHN